MEDFAKILKYLLLFAVLGMILYLKDCDPEQQTVNNCENANEQCVKENKRLTKLYKACDRSID